MSRLRICFANPGNPDHSTNEPPYRGEPTANPSTRDEPLDVPCGRFVTAWGVSGTQ